MPKLSDIEERTERAIRTLGSEISHIERPKSLFGRHHYPIEWVMLKTAATDIMRGVHIMNPEILTAAVGMSPDGPFFLALPKEFYNEKQRKEKVTQILSRARKTLEERIGA
jgi:hypothetical protein